MLKDAEVLKRFQAGGLDSVGSTPAELTAQMKSELERYREVIRKANIRID